MRKFFIFATLYKKKREMSSIENLQDKILKLEKEVQSLKDVSIFSDIRPHIEESGYKVLKISTINLEYEIKLKSKFSQLYERISRDLYKSIDKFELINPKNGRKLTNEDTLADFLQDDDIIRIDFSNIEDHCHHSHFHDDEDDEFSDDENFYSSCSCAHHS